MTGPQKGETDPMTRCSPHMEGQWPSQCVDCVDGAKENPGSMADKAMGKTKPGRFLGAHHSECPCSTLAEFKWERGTLTIPCWQAIFSTIIRLSAPPSLKSVKMCEAASSEKELTTLNNWILCPYIRTQNGLLGHSKYISSTYDDANAPKVWVERSQPSRVLERHWMEKTDSRLDCSAVAPGNGEGGAAEYDEGALPTNHWFSVSRLSAPQWSVSKHQESSLLCERILSIFSMWLSSEEVCTGLALGQSVLSWMETGPRCSTPL